MAFFNEFPHTRTYDSDLAWLIKRMKELQTRFDTLDNIVIEINNLMDEIRQMMSDLEARVEEITKQVATEEIGKYLPQNARPVAGFADINDTLSKFTYGEWSVGTNFSDGGSKLATSGSAYLIMWQTYDRILMLWEFPHTGSPTPTIGQGIVNLSNAARAKIHNVIGKLDLAETPVKYANINQTRYATNERLTTFSDDENKGFINQIYVANTVANTGGSGGIRFTMFSVKKQVEGWI